MTAEAPSPEAASARVRIDRQHPEMYKRKIEVARAVRAAVDGPDVQPVRDSEEKE